MSGLSQASSPSLLDGTPYASYAYSYPHKTAYRLLPEPVPLSDAWADENRETLFLYIHVPFCEFRCGFCNLFTLVQPQGDLSTRYVTALERQAEVIRDELPDARFVQLAIGGGTPTFLHEKELERLIDTLRRVLLIDGQAIPMGCEASPATVSLEKLRLLRDFGVDRISLGVQSFRDEDAHAMGRPQRQEWVESAITLIRDCGFPTLNLDLIYGGQGQDQQRWIESVDTALRYRPEEIYLYPLYVRPQTGLGKLDRQWDDQRLDEYRLGRDRLLEHGYRQVSMRMFQRSDIAPSDCSAYRCQVDGMMGLGTGARSYTRRLHYSSDYSVNNPTIASIIDRFIQTPSTSFAAIDYGIEIDLEDERRRYVILSLLQSEGLSLDDYRCRFGTQPFGDLPELTQLQERGWADQSAGRFVLNAAGLERSDAIGPWLYSERVRQRMETYEWH